MRRLLPYFRPYKRLLSVSTLCIFASVVVGLLSPALLSRAIDGLRGRLSWVSLTGYALMILGLTCISSLFYLLSRYLTNLVSWRVVGDIRLAFYEHVQKQSFYFFQKQRAAELMARATSELEGLRAAAGQVVLFMLQTVFTLILLVPLMLRISQRLTLLLFTTVPLAFCAVHYCNKRALQHTKKAQGYLGQILHRVEENLKGVRVVRAYSREESEIAALTELIGKHVVHSGRLLRVNALMAPLLQLLIGLSFVVNFWYASLLAVRGHITLGQFIEFNTYLMRLIWPLTAFGQTLRLYHQGLLGLQRVNAVLDTEPAVADRLGVHERPPIRGRIEFRRLTFAYGADGEAGPPVLRDVDLSIPAGRTVAFVGRTGSGKTTLMNLLPRLLEAPEGAVLVDSVPVSDYPLAQLRGAIGYAQQEPVLFSDSLAENIAFGVEGASAADIACAADIAGLTPDVRGFPLGFETFVGERGVTLSGGQKQRVALARALLRQPAILILDDALSAVDSFTAAQILKRLCEVRAGKTTLFIAHRVAAVRDADIIFVLDGGRVVERGTHDELLAAGGEYAAFYYRELLEEELAAT
jgi:ATP-binding cassette subfamily B protein